MGNNFMGLQKKYLQIGCEDKCYIVESLQIMEGWVNEK